MLLMEIFWKILEKKSLDGFFSQDFPKKYLKDCVKESLEEFLRNFRNSVLFFLKKNLKKLQKNLII